MTRVLVVDDDQDIRDTVADVLIEEGYEVVKACNGLEGLDHLHGLYNNEKPDLVLLDIMMPILDGWEFVQAKNSDITVRSIPVIVLTGLRDKENRCQIPNTLKIMHKPVTLEDLLDTVRAAVQKKRDSMKCAVNEPI